MKTSKKTKEGTPHSVLGFVITGLDTTLQLAREIIKRLDLKWKSELL